MVPTFYVCVIHALRGWKNTRERKRKSVVDAMDLLFQIGFELAAVSPKRSIRPKREKTKAQIRFTKVAASATNYARTQRTTFGAALFSE